ILFAAFQGVSAQFAEEHGGLGGAPKFPQPMIWEFVLRFARRSDNPYARRMVHTTLVKMARGGMYDQLGGGFARYSVDPLWLVPHFEKMLYDNAELASLYLHAWQAFADPECRRIAEETLDYVLREMTDPAGGFYSAAARGNAEFVLDSMRVNGRLLRTWKAGQAKLKGYLEDYAMVAAALLELYAATFDRLWLDEARGLADDILRLFWDEGIGGFFDTGADHERLIVRPRNLYDNAVPCGSSVAVEV